MSGTAGPNVRVPPPFIYVASWLLAQLLALSKPLKIDGAGASIAQVALGGVFLAAGIALIVPALITFRRARTPIVPFYPARLVVETGPFGITRNPMYLGLALGYVGLALVVNQSWPLVLLPLALIAMTKLVIEREERHLADAFGVEYERYCQRVRRWM